MEESDYEYDSYDENDDELMESVSEAIAKQVELVFPPLDELTLKWAPIHKISDTQLNKFAKLVGNLDAFYRKYTGKKNWMSDKIIEMQEPGLVYVWYVNQAQEIMGFLSFKLCSCDGGSVLYLYEIHIDPMYQALKYGSRIIDSLQKFVVHLKTDGSVKYFQGLKGVSLTVFPDNVRAFNWYKRLGYDFTEDSPRDRVLRTGKVVQPEFYLLTRFSN